METAKRVKKKKLSNKAIRFSNLMRLFFRHIRIEVYNAKVSWKPFTSSGCDVQGHVTCLHQVKTASPEKKNGAEIREEHIFLAKCFVLLTSQLELFKTVNGKTCNF